MKKYCILDTKKKTEKISEIYSVFLWHTQNKKHCTNPLGPQECDGTNVWSRANEPEFCKALGKLGDVYVNDAFGTVHRAHASTAGVTGFIPESAIGYLIRKELQFLGGAVTNPARPFTAILGGAKVSDKIKVIYKLLNKVQTLIIGGGMACTFLKAKGYKIGASLLEEDSLDYANELIHKAHEKGVELLLPVDAVKETCSEDSWAVGRNSTCPDPGT